MGHTTSAAITVRPLRALSDASPVVADEDDAASAGVCDGEVEQRSCHIRDRSSRGRRASNQSND